jgi:hypothetical protein
MIFRLGVSCFLAVCAFFFALNLTLATAILAWSTLVAVLCAGGAILLVRQPIGISTSMGKVGGSFVRWGLRAGHGRLIPAVAISWLIWTTLGCAVIGITLARAEPRAMLMLLAWTVDVMALFYILGLVLTNLGSGGPSAGILLIVAASLIAVIALSVISWRSAESDTAQSMALLLGGGPLALLGIGSGIMLVISVGGGRRMSWH